MKYSREYKKTIKLELDFIISELNHLKRVKKILDQLQKFK
jgi:hypothetical protein